MQKSALFYEQRWPSFHREPHALGPEVVWIVDKAVLGQIPGLKERLVGLGKIYAVRAGEALKDLSSFPRHFSKLASLCQDFSRPKMTVVAVGGGSIGDFAGFFASVYRRGVAFVQIPTTWLAALDSAHGGKTALNSEGRKNQLGTFYPAQRVYLIQEILLAQPEERALEAEGELAKTALLGSQQLWEKYARAHQDANQKIWNLLEDVVQVKWAIVEKDPLEIKGDRKKLNLGHTLGHVLEAAFGWPHGISVGYGLKFAIQWSESSGFLDQHVANRLILQLEGSLWFRYAERGFQQERLEEKTFAKYLQADKKRTSSGHVDFVFLEDIGQPVVKAISWNEILKEARRQGWVF